MEEGLKFAFENSKPCMTIVHKGKPVGIFGVVPTSVEGLGGIWLVGTPEMTAPENRMRFLRESKKWVDRFHEQYPTLGNYIDSRNTVHVEWVKWLGFQIHEETLINGVPFYMFSKELNNV